MACDNCAAFLKICKANCCGPVPIKNEVYEANKHLIPISREHKEIKFDEGTTIATSSVTGKEKCAFLSDENKCLIHDQRPDICRQYGDGSHLMLTCAYQMPDGRERPFQAREKVFREWEKYYRNKRSMRQN